MKKFLLLLALFCTMFSAVQATEVEIGVDDESVTTATSLPINALWKYGWSQQIYTADEIGMGGTINSITFWMYHTGSNPPAYNINVYMIEVDDEAFASTTSWVPVDEDNLVFSGITFGNLPTSAANIDEFTIELDEPFVYSGSSNLLIAFANNTGSYVSGMNAKVFGVSSGPKMTLYKYQDGSAINPSNPGLTGTLTHLRNAIKLDITAGGSTTIPCEKPSGIEASDVTAHGVTLTWADGSGVYNVEIKEGDGDWTAIPELAQTTQNTITLTDLAPSTNYQARVQSVCAGNEDNPVSKWVTCSFKTLIGLPFSEKFGATSTPEGWSQKSGLVNDVMAGTSSLATGSYWSFGTANGVFDNHAKINIYGSGSSERKHWLLSPEIPMEDNVQLTFDMALTKYSGTLVEVDKNQGKQDDDRFIVLASTDNCATWTILREWNNTGSEYVYDDIACSATGEEVAINLSQFAGENVIIAFYGESTVSGGDNEFHLDNILIDYIPRCLKPTDLKAENITTNQAELSWTANSEETEWILQYKKSAEEAWLSINVTENPYTLGNLDAYTAYDFRVAALCDYVDEFGTSKFSSEVSFKTNAAAPFAEAFTSMPSDWKRYSVLYDEIADGDTLTKYPVSSGWTVSTGNGVYGVNHLKLQVYGESVKNWIVSPFIEMNDAAMQLTFDLALTKNTGTLTPADPGQQDDDKFLVLVTADGGETWEELYVRDNVSSEDPYDNINCTADGQIVKVDLSGYAESTIAIAFYGESTVSGGNNYLHIRNIDIDTIPSCEKPMGLEISEVSTSAATFSWDEAESGAATWAYGIVANPADDFEPADEDFVSTTEDVLVTIDTLSENTPYIFFLRHACDGSNSEYIARRFLTEQTPAALPYADDFENGLNWVLINGDLTNQWVLGEAAHNGEGTHALYISNDGGTNNAYTNTAAGTVYATKTFNFEEAGTYAVNFDWRAYGESTWDILCVALVPDGTLVEATATAGQWTALPTGWVALHEGTKINLQSTWQHSSYELNLEDAGIYKVVMVWRNDGSGGTQPPAAVDNFSIERILCPTPVQLAEVAESTTTNSVQVEWISNGNEQNWFIQYKKAADEEWIYVAEDVTANPFTITGLDASSTYNVRVAAWCDPTDSLSASDFSAPIAVTTACAAIDAYPYAENFDAITGVTSGSTSVLPICWSSINTSTYSTYNGYPNVYNSSSYAASGSNSLKFYSYAYSSTYDPQDQYAILPEMENLNTLRMKFNARAYSTGSSYDAAFTVGVMSDPTDVTTFVPVANLEPAGTTYEPFEVRFNTYEGTGKYIAIKMLAADLVEDDYIHGFHMDDIVIDPIPDCFEPAAVNVLGATSTSVQFTYAANAEGDSLSYAIVLKGVEPTDFIGIAADTVLVEGLEAGTEYMIYLRTECANSASASISATFQTKQLPIDLGNGFADDFEGANQWYFENGALTNVWVHGTAAHNGEGSKAIYISNDGGASNAYTTTKDAVVYAMKAFNIAAGSYIFQYDWMAYGESSSDYIRAALVPAAIELTASTSLPTGVTTTALPEGCIAIDGGSKLNLSSAWATYTSAELAVPAGTYNVVFMWRNDYSVGTQPPAAIDNFSITKILCGKPASVTIEKANITSTSAEIAWTAEEGQTAWQIAMDTIAAFNPDSVQLISTNTNPYLAENLLSEHTYYVYVRANCGEDGFSAWSARASFKTAKSCQKPDGLDVTAITDSSAVVTWNTYGQNDFILTYGIGNAFADTVEVTGGTYTITGLAENTSYKVKVAAACDETTFSSAKTFKTACSPIAAVIEDFDGITGQTSSNVLPDCWSYINTGSSYSYLPTAYASASYANSGTNSLRFYSYASSSYADQYAILPAVTNLNTLRMKLNARKYSASYEGIVVVGIMTDPTDVATFVAIDTVAPAGIAYEPFVVSFGEYTGEGMYVALKSPLPVTSNYNGTYIDDIAMEAIPSCLEPTALVVSNIATTSATLDWTSTASQWQIILNNDSANLIDVAAKPFVLDELTSATNYTFAVRAICAVGDTSAWSKAMTFATECELISLANADYVEGFEAYEGSTYNDANGVAPVCWEVGTSGTVAPHVIGSGSYYWTHEGTKALTFYGSGDCYAILPKFAEPLNTAQISFWAAMESATNGTLYLGYITEEDPNTFNPITTYDRTVAKEMAFYETSLDTLPASASQLVFLWSYNSQWSCCIDDVTVSLIPACPKTTGLAVSNITDVTATFSWDAEENGAWDYAVLANAALDSIPEESAFATISSNSITVNSLVENTDYVFFLRANCGEDGVSEIIAKAFHTMPHPAALPFNEDFEAENDWLLINGSCTNAWVRGEAANNGGMSALYISNDGGTTNAYTVNSTTTVYAAKLLNFNETGTYSVSYDWKANGETSYSGTKYDYLRVALVPGDVELTAGTAVPSGFTATALPAGWIALDEDDALNGSNVWATKQVVVSVEPGLYNIVFAWRNDSSSGEQDPAAVDNIHIKHLNFPTDIDGNAGIYDKAVKFIRDNHVYILINGVVYNITGQVVEVK